jgi:glutamate synthase (NADPH/NADH) large chain
VIGYGATLGDIYISGVVGERFCVRNSGATAVVEGVGDHACEYMTGGTVVILGKTGRNLAAGMSGGIAYVLDLDPRNVNSEMVDLLKVPLDRADELHTIISSFARDTSSGIANELLKNWTDSLIRFSMVMPRDYARVLAAINRAEREGLSVEKLVMEVSHG